MKIPVLCVFARALRHVLLALMLMAGGVTALAWAPSALAHAALVSTDPPNEATLAAAPNQLVLTFNEPVSPLVFRLIKPTADVVVLSDVHQHDNVVGISLPPLTDLGTYALSWRVVSADGHPVGGTTLFSIGSPTTSPASTEAKNLSRSIAIWGVRLALYIALFFGIGGVLFRAFLAKDKGRGKALLTGLVAGVALISVSLGLFGLDALDMPFSGWSEGAVWATALASSVGIASGFLLLTFAAALVSQGVRGRSAKAWALLALGLLGLSLAASGHASAAAPPWLSRPAVWLHAVTIALWIGSFIPLALALAKPDPSAYSGLRRFSQLIPFVLALLIASGATLAWLQLDRLSSLWETAYGQVLLAKLVLVAGLLGLGAFNRYRLTQGALQGDVRIRQRLRRTILVEAIVAVLILAVVALWRFTPPPRALTDATVPQTISAHVHTSAAMAQLLIVPAHSGRPAQLELYLFDAGMAPLKAQEVDVSFFDSGSGIEPIQYSAVHGDDGVWRIARLDLPDLPQWTVQIDALVSDFDRITLSTQILFKH